MNPQLAGKEKQFQSSSRPAVVRVLLAGLATTFCAAQVSAAVFLRPSAIYLLDSSSNNGSNGTESRLLFDFAAGYIFDSGFTLGALYSTEKRTTISSVNGGNSQTDTTDRSSLGPSIGWTTPKGSGPYILGTYFISNQNVDEPTSNNYQGPTAYQIDLGWRVEVSKIFLAFQLSYRSFTYNRYSNGGNSQSLNPNNTQSNLDPMFGLFVEF